MSTLVNIPNDIVQRAQRHEMQAELTIFEAARKIATFVIAKRIYPDLIDKSERNELIHEIATKTLLAIAQFDINRSTTFSTWTYTIASNHVNTFLVRTIKNKLRSIRLDSISELETSEENDPCLSIQDQFSTFARYFPSCGAPWQLLTYSYCHFQPEAETPQSLVELHSQKRLSLLYQNWKEIVDTSYSLIEQEFEQLYKILHTNLSTPVRCCISKNDGVSLRAYREFLDIPCGDIRLAEYTSSNPIRAAAQISNWNYNVKKRLAIAMVTAQHHLSDL